MTPSNPLRLRPLRGLLAVFAALAALSAFGTSSASAAALHVTATAAHEDAGTWVADALDAHLGDVVALRFTVTGDPVSDATIHLDVTDCNVGTFAGAAADGNGDYDLPHGTTLAWTCLHTASDADGASVEPSISVVDAGDPGSAPIARAGTTVNVVNPLLDVTERLVVDDAGSLHPQVTIRNVGTVSLVVNATDTHCPNGFSDAGGAPDGILDVLDAGATDVLTCDLVLGQLIPGSSGTTTVTGYDRTGGIVSVKVADQPLPGPTAVAGASSAPAARGLAVLLRPVGCQRNGFAIELRGRSISSVSLRIDGKRRTFANTSADRKEWTLVLDVRALGAGRHLFQATVHFTKASHTRARTLTRHVRVCRRSALEVRNLH